MKPLSLFLFLAVAACGGSGTTVDLGVVSDLGTHDARVIDAAGGDGGALDAATADAGTVDASTADATALDSGDASAVDAGGSDAGTLDAGAFDAGSTGMTCGGRGGGVCTMGFFCNYSLVAICGRADGTGTCSAIPPASSCPSTTSPVCGCDGTTYGNTCLANSAGTSVSVTGVCPPPLP